MLKSKFYKQIKLISLLTFIIYLFTLGFPSITPLVNAKTDNQHVPQLPNNANPRALKMGEPPIDPNKYQDWKRGYFNNRNSTQSQEAHLLSYQYLNGIMSNEHIEYRVEDGDYDKGTFTIGTTGGNPNSITDDSKKLLYGHPYPGTSFTTVQIDGSNYVYEPNTQNPTPDTNSSSNISEFTFGDVSVKQIISIVKSSSTGRNDTVQVKYVATNRGTSNSHDLGIRIMMDTQLGSNDGAPFRVPGIGAITNEFELTGTDIPEYWQAFDSLTSPNVVSQGSLLGALSNRPDKVQFAAWPYIVDTLWDYIINPQNFVTWDSAVAVYWNPKNLAPGESREYVTHYGVSEFNQDLTPPLGLTVAGASFVDANKDPNTGKVGYIPNPFTVYGYILNNGGVSATNVKAKIHLPPGLKLKAGEQQEVNIGTLGANQEMGVDWQVEVEPMVNDQSLVYYVTVTADGVEPKTVSKEVIVSDFDGLITGWGAVDDIAKIDPININPFSLAQDPVDTSTGAHLITQNLLKVDGAMPIQFNLQYNSLLLKAGPMGQGWGHNFEPQLNILQNGDIKLHWNANRVNLFVYNGNNSFSSIDSATRFDKLTKNTDGSFSLSRKDKSIYVFNAIGKLIEQKNGHGQSLVMSYGSSGRMEKVSEPISGRYLTLHYNPDGLLYQVKDGLNRQVTFEYDNVNKLLTKIIDPKGQPTSFHYTPEGQVEYSVDAEGIKIFHNTYDSKGRVATQDDARIDNLITRFYYDEISQPGNVTTTVYDRVGNVRVLTHNSKYLLLSLKDELGNMIANYEYYPEGLMKSFTDANGKTITYTYDERGNLATMSDPFRAPIQMTYNIKDNLESVKNSVGTSVYYYYNDNNNVIKMIDPLGKETNYQYYTDTGLLWKITKPGTGTKEFTYVAGQVYTMQNETGVLTTYEYDTVGRLKNIIIGGKTTSYTYDNCDNIDTITDPLKNSRKYTYNSHNNVLSETDARTFTTYYIYTPNQKLEKVIDALNNQTTYKYDGEDRLKYITDARGKTTEYINDPKGRLTGVKDALGNISTIEYDKLDRVIGQFDALQNKVLSISYDDAANTQSVTDAVYRTTVHKFDNADRLVKLTAPMLRQTDFEYDGFNRLIHVIDPLLGESRQRFDLDGNLTTLIDPNNNDTNFEYFLDSHIKREYSQSGLNIRYTYNTNGLLETMTNSRDQVTTYQYYDNGLVKSFTDPTGTVTYTYDPNGNIGTVSNANGTSHREYDKLNRVIKYTDILGNTIQYQYDTVGNMVYMIYPDNKQVKYDYYDNNLLKTVTDWANRITSYEYDKNGRLTKIRNSNNTTVSYLYDEAGQLMQQKEVDSNGNIINQYDFTYSDSGYVKTEQSSIQEQPPILTDSLMTYTQDNRLATFNGQAVQYDADGNMINGAMSNFTFDARNRLINAGDVSYIYDAENNRVGVKEGSNRTDYVVNPHAGLSQVLVKMGPDGQKVYYIYGLGLIGQEENGAYHTYHYDRRGSTVALTDESGNVTDRFQYGPYGEPGAHDGSTLTPFLYNGREGVMTDSNGLYYMRARYYSPETRRFLNRDSIQGSIEQTQSLNRYSYVLGNPVSYIDPEGKAAWIVAGAAVGGLYGLGGQVVSDLVAWELSDWETYAGSIAGGAAGGATTAATGSIFLGSLAMASSKNTTTQVLYWLTDDPNFNPAKGLQNAAQDAVLAGLGGAAAGRIIKPTNVLQNSKWANNVIKRYPTGFFGQYAQRELWIRGSVEMGMTGTSEGIGRRMFK